MGQFPNKETQFKTGSKQVEIARKAGLKRTPKKKYMARLRALRNKGLTDDTYKKLVNMMEEPESDILDIKLFLESLKKDANIKGSEKIRLANALISLHKAHHGEKRHITGEITQNIKAVQIHINYPDGYKPKENAKRNT